MNILNSFSIKSKLMIVALIPLAALIYALQGNIRAELADKASAETLLKDVGHIQAIAQVVHELSIERALTLAYYFDSRTEKKAELDRQRLATDKALYQWEQSTKGPHNAYAGMDSLPAIRARVNELSDRNTADQFYNDFKGRLLDEVSVILRSSVNTRLKNRFEEHLFLINTKETMAQLRTALAAGITAGRFAELEYGRFASSKGQHELNLEKLRKVASPELAQFLQRKYDGPFVRRTYEIIETAFQNPGAFPISFSEWWDVSTASINALKEADDYSIAIIREHAQAELDTSVSRVVQTISLTVGVVIVIFLLLFSTIRGIVQSISTLRVAANRMSRGELDIVLDVDKKDEIGNLAQAFSQMITATRAFSDVADLIGRGDYSAVVNVRGESDRLGLALDKMKTNLKKLSADNDVRTWLLTGISQLNDKMRGEKDARSLASEVISQLADYLKAQIAALYVVRDGRLELLGSYAYFHRKDNNSVIQFGQGLVGQAALEKKPITFSEIPDDYVRINSGLGNSTPRNILVFPFAYEGDVKGVIEIGTNKAITDLDMELLNLANENIGIAFNAAESRDTLKTLLEETQRQSEELQAQQEELKQSNEELQEKTGLLEKSEAELKAQQEELQQANEELEEKANLLEAQKEKLENAKMDIENKARELEATSKYKSEFLANMSHELRTPLNSILILAQILSENKNNVLGEKELDFAKNIYDSGTDLLNLINEILDLSKVESGKMELEVEDVFFDDVVKSMRSMFSEVARSKSIDFTIDIAPGVKNLKRLRTDGDRLEQILRNLLSNAFKFTEREGSVSLTIGQSTDGRAANEGTNHAIAFTVKDTGIGIPRHKQGVIFEAFQQADGSTKRKYGGTGLGLSICRELASALGGTIDLQSEEGVGSTFTLCLPLALDESEQAITENGKPVGESIAVVESSRTGTDAPPDTSIEDDRHHIRVGDRLILIVEDDVQFASLLLDFVRERNYKGIVAHQGNIGLSHARHYKPDAIILDMKLPVLDGASVLKHLKNDPHLRHIPVQVLSGYNMRKIGLEAGAFDFVKKPLSREQLREAFGRVEEFMARKLKRLLVVEDNETQNKAIRELIGNGDVKSYPAHSGQEALALLKSERFDCMIIDLGLPDVHGLDLLKEIKTDEKINKIPIVVYTGKEITREESNLLNRLANTVVLKTVHSFDRLLDETTLFLHRVESKLPPEKQNMIRKLHKSDEVLKNKTVLVVDDDIRNIYSLTNALAEEGLNCLVAENGRAAIEMLKSTESIDMVLMDVMMPEMDGYEATREIRKHERFSKLPVVALTAKAMKGDREKCLAAGMSDYISKPVNMDQLLSLMRVWLYL